MNKENVFESYSDCDVLYVSAMEVLYGNIMKNKFESKPEYYTKSIHANADKLKLIKSISKDVKLISPMEIYYKQRYETVNKISKDEEKCIICLDGFYNMKREDVLETVWKMNQEMALNYDVVLLEKCLDHFFHVECMADMVGKNNFIKCPVCMKIYGIQVGTQPPGTMTARIDNNVKCSGFDVSSICIDYTFPGGKKDDGTAFTGTHRRAFLPNNNDGLKILGFFKVGFDRKLIFTVGTSVTTGQANTTVWAGIHHKTNTSGGTSSFGFPDTTYFTRVQEELAAKGVTLESLDEDPVIIGKKFLGIN